MKPTDPVTAVGLVLNLDWDACYRGMKGALGHGKMGAFEATKNQGLLFLSFQGTYEEAVAAVKEIEPIIGEAAGAIALTDDPETPRLLWQKGNGADRLLKGTWWRARFGLSGYSPPHIREMIALKMQEAKAREAARRT